jgi:hypothetical protein
MPNDLIQEFTNLYPRGFETVSRPAELRLYHGSETESIYTGTRKLAPQVAEEPDGHHTVRLDYKTVDRLRSELAARLRRDAGTTTSMARLAYEVFTDRAIEMLQYYRGPTTFKSI